MASSSPRATLFGLLAIALWSTLALLTIWTGSIPPFQLTAMTFAIGGLAGVAVAAARGRLALLLQPPAAWALGLYGLFLYHTAYFAALKMAPPVEASLINYLWPLLLVLMTGLLPGHRLEARHLIGAALGLGAVLLLTLGNARFAGGGAATLGYGLAFASAFIWSSYSVLSRRMADVPTEAVAGFCLATAALAGLVHLMVETTVTAAPASAWMAVVALGIGPVGAAFFLWDMGMKHGNIRLIAVASYATPVISTALLAAFGGVQLGPTILLACGMIVAGAILARK